MARDSDKKRFYLQTVVCILIACAFIAYCTVSFYKYMKLAKEDQTLSAIVSLHARIMAHAQDYNPEFLQHFQNGGKQWQFLSDDEYDKITAILEQDGFRIDAGHPNGYPVDTWDNRLVISFRRLSDGQLDFNIVSKGPDGIHDTKDDITSPYNNDQSLE